MTGEGAASAGLGDDHPAVELSQPSEEELAETTEETVYTSGISELWWWWFNVSCIPGSPCIPHTYASQISYFATVLANNENGCGHIEHVVMFISLSLSLTHSLTHPLTFSFTQVRCGRLRAVHRRPAKAPPFSCLVGDLRARGRA